MGNKMKRFLSTALVLAMLSTNSLTALATESVDSTQVETQAATSVSTEEANTSAAAKNERTGETYESVTDALFTASEGDTVTLLKDEEVSIVSVIDDVTLDLNGHTLEASYVTCFGNIVDESADNTGLLKVETKRFLIQDKNKQLPMKNGKGYQFFEVEKFNKAWQKELSRYSFQTCVEPSALELIMQGTEVTGVTVNVRVSWTQGDGLRTQDFTYNDELVNTFFGSYKEASNSYAKMFTLVLNGTSAFEELTFSAVMVSDTGVEIASDSITVDTKEDTQNPDDTEKPDDTENPGSTGSSDVTTDENNKVTGNVQIEAGQASANVSAGTQLDENTNELKLTVKEMDVSNNEIEVDEKEEIHSVNVHVDGVAENNTVPIIITVDEFAPEFLNQGNIRLYHVENGTPVEMTRVFSLEEVDAHNEYYYDPATGIVTMTLATFSEIAAVSDTENEWNGEFDYSWYTNAVATADEEGTTEYTIANADQLAAFGAIVGGMNEEGTSREGDSFAGKTVKLLSDINLGDDEENNNEEIIFYPIGYYNNTETGSYGKTSGGSVESSVSSFEGTFDGNGHTISNFYQNTWEMFGDYNSGYDGTPNHYKDAMGLFGYVVDGTVKNLTVDNFSSDGEFTPTGVIAAYAVNSTFENIAITNCNPRVYNTGNGGIVGIGGNSDDTEDLKLTFNNITIDNTNKITALWGSWDVACGGLVGMFRGAGHAYMTNCHVAAQMDVYNDVCGNYQYYWYRYSGMMIGTNKNMITDKDGYTVPETSKFHAENCTVHFGEWNDYYYCELVANSLASYTHDHQFSRLEQVDSVDVENMTVTIGEETTAIPTSGRYNYVVVNGKAATENATCYHFVDGKVWNHKDAGTETVDINGDGVKETVLKEDRQHYYLPFNQLFTGYGWGVKHIPVYNGEDYAFEGITILDREVADSVVKFDTVVEEGKAFTTETTVTIGELFKAIEQTKDPIENANVQVTVSPVGDDSTAGGTYAANTTDWTQGTLTFSGTGSAQIIITDYNYCEKTTLNVTITEKEAVEKFETKFTGDFLYRVGNQNAVELDSLFKVKDRTEIGNVSVTVEAVEGSAATGTYTTNATWTNGTIQFKDTGVVKVTIKDNDPYCKPTELILEVVDAVNATNATNATSNNVVLLNDIGSGFTVSGRYTVYGNGFTLNYTGNGQYLNNGLKQGVVTVSENGTLDNLRIKASIYPSAYLYYGTTVIGDYVQSGPSTIEGDKTRYHYQLSSIAASGNATVSNCYVYGGRNNIFINTGDVTIKDSVLECGTVANVQIQSNSSHTITFDDVTTIQYQVNPTIGDTSKVMLGAGIIVGPETTENPNIVLNGEFKQYNWVTNEDANAVSDTKITKAIIEGALKAADYNHTVNGKVASNMGVIYVNEFGANVTNNTGLPYKLGNVDITVSGQTVSGQVYSLKGATSEQIYSDYANADKTTDNDLYKPQFKYSDDLGGQYIPEGGDEHCYREGDTIHVMFPSGDTKELNLAKLVDISKYTGQDLGLKITCKNDGGNAVTVTDGKVTLSTMGEYGVTYTVTDTVFFDKDGNKLGEPKSITYSWDVAVNVSLKDTAIPDAYFDYDATKQTMGYAKKSMFAGGNTQYLPFLAGLKIYDYNGQNSYLRFDGDNDFNKIASATITGYTSANHVLIEVKLTDGGVIDIDTTARAASGGSTYTGKIQTSGNTVYYVNDGTTSATITTWVISSYKFTGNNGVEINSGAVTFNNCENGSVPTGSFNTTIKYTVTYDANEGNCGQTTGYATSASAAVTLPTPTRSGYLFSGWFTATYGGTRVGGAGEYYTPTANITLYAQWGKPSTVTYNANGGSCDKESEKYTGTALTLPTPTRDGYWFTGWYDAAEGGNKIDDAGATYNPKGDITLYAHWQKAVEYTVTYNANGGTCGTASATYRGTSLTLPTPTRTGYKFLGWYTAASGGTKIGDAGANYTPSSNITLYAQWEQISYTITISKQDNATVTVDKTTAYYNDTISVTVSFSQNNSKTLTVKDASGNTVLSKSAAGTYTFTMPASNVKIEASSYGSCVTADTLVTLADGTQKRIDEVTYNDELLAWDFFEGEYAIVPPAIIYDHGWGNSRIIKLNFDDGTEVKVTNVHQFFDVTLNEYVDITAESVESYIGHEFVKQAEDGFKTVKLIEYDIYNEYVKAYGINSAVHYNIFVEGMLSMDFDPAYRPLFSYFEFGDNLMYDAEKMQADIEKYGLYTYDDFDEYITYEQYEAFNAKYMKVSVGKGLYTFEGIVDLINGYLK